MSAGIYRVVWYKTHVHVEDTTRVERVTLAGIRSALAGFRVSAQEINGSFLSYQAEVGRMDVSPDALGNNVATFYVGF